MRALALAMGVLAFAPSASATLVDMLPLPELAKRADLVVSATVVDVRIEEEAGGKLATYTTLLVDDAAKGAERGELLVVFQPGAIVDGRSVRWVAGQPRYRVGERIAFLGVRHRRDALDVVVHLTFLAFDIDPAYGTLIERDLGVVDRRTARPPALRAFPSWSAFRQALLP